MLDPPNIFFRLSRFLPIIPRWLSGTAATGQSDAYAKMCVASEGYRDDLIRLGLSPEKLVVTGIPNFDDCARYLENRFPLRGYVLVCTSDARETFKRDDRGAFLDSVRRIAVDRPLVFKLHPNEDATRAEREIRERFPQATIYTTGSAEEMVANAAIVVCQWSSVAFVALALGKEVHSYFDPTELKRLMPVQNGGRSAQSIAAVCREVLGLPHPPRATESTSTTSLSSMPDRPSMPGRPERAPRSFARTRRQRVVTVVQARMGSTRLRGKVLLPAAGAPLLQRQLERMARARTPMEIVVATTTASEDDPIEALSSKLGVACHRGHPTDLLDRHLSTALNFGAEVVVKIPSDCPLIDPQAIERVLGAFLEHPDRYDYVSNLHPASWPDGNDVEVMPLSALELAWCEATRAHEREHTTPFLWDQPERFRLANVRLDGGRDLSMSHRLVLDYPEDYALISRIYDALWRPARPDFQLRDILEHLEREPELLALNAQHRGVSWHRHHLGELRTMSPTAELRTEVA